MEFEAFPKIPRLFREVVVTEKIDGTNAAVVIEPVPDTDDFTPGVRVGDYIVYAQSRKRFVAPGFDNHGFAAWAWEHAEALTAALGPGRHFGEWWGQGIGRGYGLDHKRFSLFNTARWAEVDFAAHGLDNVAAVPVLDTGSTDITGAARNGLNLLLLEGSHAAPGFDRPEGVIAYHAATNQMFKATLENDDRGKEYGA